MTTSSLYVYLRLLYDKSTRLACYEQVGLVHYTSLSHMSLLTLAFASDTFAFTN